MEFFKNSDIHDQQFAIVYQFIGTSGSQAIAIQREQRHVFFLSLYPSSNNKCSLSALWVLDCSLITLWPRKMKIESSRQTWTERTNERTKIVTPWAPVGAKNHFLAMNESRYILENDTLELAFVTQLKLSLGTNNLSVMWKLGEWGISSWN